VLLRSEDARALERRLAELEDVLGVVVLDVTNESPPLEVQVFLSVGTDDGTLRDSIRGIAEQTSGVAVDVSLFHAPGGTRGTTGVVAGAATDVEAAPDDGGRGRTDGRRPRLLSVVLDSSALVGRHQAVVSLAGAADHTGRAELDGDPLLAVVRATCDAIRAATGGTVADTLGLQQTTVGGVPVIVVTLSLAGRVLVGAARAGHEPVQTTAVRASLDALNRWITADPQRAEPASEQR
jgi:hypothetical protein